MRVRAKRLGWDEKLTEEQLLDMAPLEAEDMELEGELTIVDVPESDEMPAMKLYLVDGQEADPATVVEL